MLKENKDGTNKWKDRPCSWIGRLNNGKMSTLPKAMYRFNVLPNKILITFLQKYENHPKIHIKKSQGTPNGQNNLEKKIWRLHTS